MRTKLAHQPTWFLSSLADTCGFSRLGTLPTARLTTSLRTPVSRWENDGFVWSFGAWCYSDVQERRSVLDRELLSLRISKTLFEQLASLTLEDRYKLRRVVLQSLGVSHLLEYTAATMFLPVGMIPGGISPQSYRID